MGTEHHPLSANQDRVSKREYFIDILLVRNHFIIVMIRWTGLVPWEFKFYVPCRLTKISDSHVRHMKLAWAALSPKVALWEGIDGGT